MFASTIVGRREVPATPRRLNVESGITTASPSPSYSPSLPRGPTDGRAEASLADITLEPAHAQAAT
ncbi:hypothetical protein ACGFSD_05990 [Streptomyces caniferus]|uniref:hypothetical protein n=1 Tax=Streptomyces caniferus TaxID=285557 RepID=UPI0037176CA2